MASATHRDDATLRMPAFDRSQSKASVPTVVTELVPVESDYFIPQSRWLTIRELLSEPAGEFVGTMILVIFGAGVNCQATLSSNPLVSGSPKGDYVSVCFGWAAGIALGAWVSGGISGGHINPAVTLAFATLRGFPWRKVPAYIFAQLLGALCGAGVVYANYIHAIDAFEGGRHVRTVPGTAGLFGTYAADYMTPVSCFFEEYLGTAILLIVICAVTDKRNTPPPAGLVPLVLFVTILGIAASLGMQTGFALNPARDLGPRILTAMVGYGKDVFTYRRQYWLWCPILAPILGALSGTFLYDLFFYKGADSVLNKSNSYVPSQKDLRHSIAESVV
ncbi:aquaporin [Phanerochaete sordida]|uniref:Aquaporin n=1 Tax=Phanerochaete sordida TaxID=48140 RepID=A0A9P3GRP9_9APHY|nr:aquaporin [Phanerochaete sordida]